MIFPLKFSLVHANKSAESSGFVHIYLKKIYALYPHQAIPTISICHFIFFIHTKLCDLE